LLPAILPFFFLSSIILLSYRVHGSEVGTKRRKKARKALLEKEREEEGEVIAERVAKEGGNAKGHKGGGFCHLS